MPGRRKPLLVSAKDQPKRKRRRLSHESKSEQSDTSNINTNSNASKEQIVDEGFIITCKNRRYQVRFPSTNTDKWIHERHITDAQLEDYFSRLRQRDTVPPRAIEDNINHNPILSSHKYNKVDELPTTYEGYNDCRYEIQFSITHDDSPSLLPLDLENTAFSIINNTPEAPNGFKTHNENIMRYLSKIGVLMERSRAIATNNVTKNLMTILRKRYMEKIGGIEPTMEDRRIITIVGNTLLQIASGYPSSKYGRYNILVPREPKDFLKYMEGCLTHPELTYLFVYTAMIIHDDTKYVLSLPVNKAKLDKLLEEENTRKIKRETILGGYLHRWELQSIATKFATGSPLDLITERIVYILQHATSNKMLFNSAVHLLESMYNIVEDNTRYVADKLILYLAVDETKVETIITLLNTTQDLKFKNTLITELLLSKELFCIKAWDDFSRTVPRVELLVNRKRELRPHLAVPSWKLFYMLIQHKYKEQPIDLVKRYTEQYLMMRNQLYRVGVEFTKDLEDQVVKFFEMIHGKKQELPPHFPNFFDNYNITNEYFHDGTSKLAVVEEDEKVTSTLQQKSTSRYEALVTRIRYVLIFIDDLTLFRNGNFNEKDLLTLFGHALKYKFNVDVVNFDMSQEQFFDAVLDAIAPHLDDANYLEQVRKITFDFVDRGLYKCNAGEHSYHAEIPQMLFFISQIFCPYRVSPSKHLLELSAQVYLHLIETILGTKFTQQASIFNHASEIVTQVLAILNGVKKSPTCTPEALYAGTRKCALVLYLLQCIMSGQTSTLLDWCQAGNAQTFFGKCQRLKDVILNRHKFPKWQDPLISEIRDAAQFFTSEELRVHGVLSRYSYH